MKKIKLAASVLLASLACLTACGGDGKETTERNENGLVVTLSLDNVIEVTYENSELYFYEATIENKSNRDVKFSEVKLYEFKNQTSNYDSLSIYSKEVQSYLSASNNTFDTFEDLYSDAFYELAYDNDSYIADDSLEAIQSGYSNWVFKDKTTTTVYFMLFDPLTANDYRALLIWDLEDSDAASAYYWKDLTITSSND